MIYYAHQDICEKDIEAVIDVLRSEFLTQGPAIPAFEQAVASYCGSKHAVAVNSGTSALHIACIALGVGKGDIVWTSPITFVASANCALYCGATVDFVDIDERTYNMSTDALELKLKKAKLEGKLPKVIIPVHFCGQPCEMEKIHSLSKLYGFKIIEDAAHAIGGKYKGEAIGNCCYSDITVFSFHPVKIITSGEGGMALTNDGSIAKRLQLLRSHGITSSSSEMSHRPSHEIWNYQQIYLGFNYRMTDISAALGLSQLARIDEFVAIRHELAERYNQLLSKLPVTLPWQHRDGNSSYHLYIIRLKLNEISVTKKRAFETLKAEGVIVNLHYIPVYLHPYYEKIGFKRGYCPVAESFFSDAVTIPLYSALSISEQDQVINAIAKALLS